MIRHILLFPFKILYLLYVLFFTDELDIDADFATEEVPK